ncbi:hypothetical protein PMAYCL1PPCAC_10698 [Pristionchus mayeri]|uniref:Uncharacterized protein n=1 Tax=Pristionchus mayeri TaxID=1317129 RepID=A0AAN5C7M3_9BILA|nr:hypothetical protein PMAYCL1PPCAC_10698 [Pristionchus mayeri]
MKTDRKLSPTVLGNYDGHTLQPSDKIDIIAKPEATASTGYRMIGTFDKTIASITQDQVRMFYKATTDLLTFKYRNPLPRGDAAARDLISALFRSTQCKHVRVDFVGGQRCTENFLSGINLAESEVILAWDCTPLHSTILARRILEQIPKIKKFKVEWQLRGINDSPADAPILDDATLLHVASHTIDCHLVARGTYTVQGIIAAFEVVCNSSNEDKYVQILVEKALIDELFARANRLNEIYERVPLRGVLRMYRDRTRRATLQATCSAIYIQRIPAGVDII